MARHEKMLVLPAHLQVERQKKAMKEAPKEQPEYTDNQREAMRLRSQDLFFLAEFVTRNAFPLPDGGLVLPPDAARRYLTAAVAALEFIRDYAPEDGVTEEEEDKPE